MGADTGVLFVLQDHSIEEIVPDRPGGVYRDGSVLRKPLRPHKGFPYRQDLRELPCSPRESKSLVGDFPATWGFVLATRSDSRNRFSGMGI